MKTDKQITCLSDHLTSFMVLASSNNKVRLKLTNNATNMIFSQVAPDSESFPLVIYVGCGTAVIFLLIAIILLIAIRLVVCS